MRRWVQVALAALLLAGLATLRAQSLDHAAPSAPAAKGEVHRTATRAGVTVPVYAYWRADAQATVVLFSGGGGGYGQIGPGGWPGGGNFLIRTGTHWARYPLNIVMVGRPSDGLDLAQGWIRTGAQHIQDNDAVIAFAKTRSTAPLWLVGTSMGTISAAASTVADTTGQVAGLVLTSSILSYKIQGAVPTQRLDRVRVPVLIVHHAEDACWACSPADARRLGAAFTHAPVVKTWMVTGGEGIASGPCDPLHYHGYVGQQEAVVDGIASWILAPQP